MNRKKEFTRFYEDNIDKIYRFVFFRVGRDRALVEDLVSEIFIKALNNFDGYDEKISRSAWLYTIAKNHIANYWRDRKEEVSLPESSPDDGENGVGLDDLWFREAADKFKEAGEKAFVYELLSQLNYEDRELVTLHYLYGYSYSEIAEMVSKNEVAVKVAAHRAIKKLKNIWDL